MTMDPIPADPRLPITIIDAIGAAERALLDASIPLHILLTTRFGELNDNQEEMVGAAAGALNKLAQELVLLKALAEPLERSATIQQRPVRIGEILRALQPELQDLAARMGASLHLSIEPGLPYAVGDERQLRDGIRLALTDDTRFATPGTVITVTAAATTSEILVTAESGTARSPSAATMHAARILAAQGARLEFNGGRSIIGVPRKTAA